MLQILRFKLRVLVHIVFCELLFYLFLFIIHESIELFDIELTLSEVHIRVKLVVYH
jgi:hypothetical protein